MAKTPEIKVPESFVTAPDDTSRIERTADPFFEDVLNALGYTDPKTRTGAAVEYYQLEHQNGAPSDTQIVVLRVENRIIASIMEWRDDFNFCQILPALHLTEELTEEVRFDPDATPAAEEDSWNF